MKDGDGGGVDVALGVQVGDATTVGVGVSAVGPGYASRVAVADGVAVADAVAVGEGELTAKR